MNIGWAGYGPEVLRWSHGLAMAGVAAAIAAVVLDGSAARAAAAQTWPAFVLVAGLLLVGLVAAEDHLFAAAGGRLASAARDRRVLFAGVALLVALVTAVLNLDTSVAFLAPVLVHTARRRDEPEGVLLSLCLLMSNAGSLLLPGSNLTHLIVLDGHHVSGGTFVVAMALPWIVAVVVTAMVVAVGSRPDVAGPGGVDLGPAEKPVIGLGLLGVLAVVALVLALGDPAPAVAAVGVVAATIGLVRHRISMAQVKSTLDLPVLVGLLGLAVGLGALGRNWSAPADALRHMDPWATAGFGAVATVAVNNLPAAALLSARPPGHPFSLLIGLDIGPNLFVTGSLAWVLWHASARAAGGHPQVRRTVCLGLVAAPLSLVLAEGALLLTGHRT